MSEADTESSQSTVNIRINDTFLADIDACWEELGYNTRSEYIRAVLRDAVKHPEFNRADLKTIAASEVDIQQGNVSTSDEIKSEYDLSTGESSEGSEDEP